MSKQIARLVQDFHGVLNVTVSAGTTKEYSTIKDFSDVFGNYVEAFRPFDQLRIISLDQDAEIYVNAEREDMKFVLKTATLQTPALLTDMVFDKLILKANATNDTTFCLELVGKLKRPSLVTVKNY